LNKTAPRCEQVSAVAGLKKIIHYPMRNAIGDAVVGKSIPVEARNPFSSAKPDESVRGLPDPSDVVARQPVCGCIDFDRQPLRVRDGCQSEQQQDRRAARMTPLI